MELGLSGKNVIVTGGGSNIGRSIVHAFAAEGCNLTTAELSLQHGELVAAEVEAQGAGGRVKVIESDVTDHRLVDSMVDQSIAESGGVDVLVNNVGWTVDRLFMEKPSEEWEKEVQVNLWGAINCVHAVLPHMIERGTGSIVCISSDAGRMGEFREAVYSACKAGVIAPSASPSPERPAGMVFGLTWCVPDLWRRPKKSRSAERACGTRCGTFSRTTCGSGRGGHIPCAGWLRRGRWRTRLCS